MTKRVFFAFVICFACSVQNISAQHLDVQFGAGLGESYIVEQIQASDINYHNTVSIFAAVKFLPDSSYFNLKLMYQHVSSQVKGYDWEGKTNNYDPRAFIPAYSAIMDGDVLSNTFFLLLEHVPESKKFNVGYDVGIGYTSEHLTRSSNNVTEIRSFVSFRLGGIARYKIGQRSSLSLEPSIFWTDIVNSFRSENYKVAREDVSVLFNLCYSYRLF